MFICPSRSSPIGWVWTLIFYRTNPTAGLNKIIISMCKIFIEIFSYAPDIILKHLFVSQIISSSKFFFSVVERVLRFCIVRNVWSNYCDVHGVYACKKLYSRKYNYFCQCFCIYNHFNLYFFNVKQLNK